MGLEVETGITVGLGLRDPGLNVFFISVHYFFHFISFNSLLLTRNDHTTMTAPLPVCSAKLSIVGPG